MERIVEHRARRELDKLRSKQKELDAANELESKRVRKSNFFVRLPSGRISSIMSCIVIACVQKKRRRDGERSECVC